jgi:hypothetical protein
MSKYYDNNIGDENVITTEETIVETHESCRNLE